jgi:hypothetical protein
LVEAALNSDPAYTVARLTVWELGHPAQENSGQHDGLSQEKNCAGVPARLNDKREVLANLPIRGSRIPPHYLRELTRHKWRALRHGQERNSRRPT